MNRGLQVMNDLLPHVTQFAKPFANSFGGLLTQLDKGVKSKGFQDFMDKFSKLVGPSTSAIGSGIGKVASAIGALLTSMSGKDVAHGINIIFDGLAGTIKVVTATVKGLMQAWDGAVIAAHNVESAFDTVRHSIAGAFDTVRHFIAGGGHDIAQDFDQVRHAVATVGHDIASAFDHVRHDIAAKFDGVKAAILSKFDGAASWLKSAAHNIANAFDHVRHDIAAWFDGVKGAITGKFSGAIGWLVSVGKNIVQGLINGLNSMLPGLSGVIGHITSIVKSVASALGIKSPSTVMYGYGQNVAQGLAQGMMAGAGQVQYAAGMLAAAAAGGGATPARGWVTDAGAMAGSPGRFGSQHQRLKARWAP